MNPQPTDLAAVLERHPADLKAEVVAADLVANGFDLEAISVSLLGMLQRPYRKDIVAVTQAPGPAGSRRVTLAMPREGLYDALPEGLFHPVREREPAKPLEQIQREMDEHRQQEQRARKFFAAFESEFFRHRVRVESMERQYFLAGADGEYRAQLFREIWGEAPFLTTTQQAILLTLLPQVHRLANDLPRVARCLERLLGQRVSVTPGPAPAFKAPAHLLPRLGRARLAGDFALGGKVDSNTPSVLVRIGLRNLDALEDYLPGGKMPRKVLPYLYGCFLPVEAEVRTKLYVPKKDRRFAPDGDGPASRLGYSSYL